MNYSPASRSFGGYNHILIDLNCATAPSTDRPGAVAPAEGLEGFLHAVSQNGVQARVVLSDMSEWLTVEGVVRQLRAHDTPHLKATLETALHCAKGIWTSLLFTTNLSADRTLAIINTPETTAKAVRAGFSVVGYTGNITSHASEIAGKMAAAGARGVFWHWQSLPQIINSCQAPGLVRKVIPASGKQLG